ncbi:hypothetical protein ACWEQB_04955 [Streptomyces cyaneofuscatus]
MQEINAAGTTPGQVVPIYVVLDQTDEHLTVARAEQAWGPATSEIAATADEYLRILAAADSKSRLALQMAGTSRKEHTQLTKQAGRAAG